MERCLCALKARYGRPTTNGSSCQRQQQLVSLWEAKALEKLVSFHQAMVHKHHTHEDTTITPGIAQRVHLPTKSTEDHQHLVAALVEILDLCRNLSHSVESKRPKDAAMLVDSLVEKWKQYHAEMKEHLQEEEEIALPLLRAYFTPKEYADLRENHEEDQPTKVRTVC